MPHRYDDAEMVMALPEQRWCWRSRRSGLMILDVSKQRTVFVFKDRGVILLGLVKRKIWSDATGFRVRETTYHHRPKSKIRQFLCKHVLYDSSKAMTAMQLTTVQPDMFNFTRNDLSARVCGSPLSYQQLLRHSCQACKRSRFQRLFVRKPWHPF